MNPIQRGIDYVWLSKIFDNFDEMEFTAFSIVAQCPAMFGYELDISKNTNFNIVLNSVKHYPFTCIKHLASPKQGRKGYYLHIDTYNPRSVLNGT